MSGAEHLLMALLRLSGEFSLALLLLLALRSLWRRAFGAGSAYAAWLIVPLLMLVAQLPASRPGLVLHRLVIAEVPPALAAAPAAADPGFEGLARALLAFWLLGALAVVALLALRQRRFAAGLRFDLEQDCWRAAPGSGPALLGLLRPRLCLPEDFEQRFTPAQQQLIRAHEEVHRRRADNAWNLLAAALCALQWFNPLAWLAQRALRADQELSCDEAVLRGSPAQAADYAHALLQAQGYSPASGLPWASWRSTHPLVERIAMLKFHAQARRKTGLAALLLLGMLGGGAVHALQSEQTPSNADVRLDVTLEFDTLVNGKPSHGQTSISASVPKDAQVQLHLPTSTQEPEAGEVELLLSAAPYKDGQWKISSEIRRDGKMLSKPKLITANGTKAVIEVGERDAKGQDNPVVRVAITPTALKPQP
jgi:beta-lactamase regulating signal transducer with metallopeptidase domain